MSKKIKTSFFLYIFLIYCYEIEFKIVNVIPDPHSLPVGGGFARKSCVPTSIKRQEEEGGRATVVCPDGGCREYEQNV